MIASAGTPAPMHMFRRLINLCFTSRARSDALSHLCSIGVRHLSWAWASKTSLHNCGWSSSSSTSRVAARCVPRLDSFVCILRSITAHTASRTRPAARQLAAAETRQQSPIRARLPCPAWWCVCMCKHFGLDRHRIRACELVAASSRGETLDYRVRCYHAVPAGSAQRVHVSHWHCAKATWLCLCSSHSTLQRRFWALKLKSGHWTVSQCRWELLWPDTLALQPACPSALPSSGHLQKI